MIRRSFFQTLAAALPAATGHRGGEAHQPQPPGPPHRGAVPTRLPPRTHHPHRIDHPVAFLHADKSPHYLLGWCQTRQAARTFRLDRMELAGPARLG